ncbi:Peptidase B [Gossypium australe]|uniref:Peptidase B n=1 Tax=Gossypium australe TaxID=47621 RepID=A0A5B6XB98_9ROSI|nr:Peptidase B [Gossypium australe]
MRPSGLEAVCFLVLFIFLYSVEGIRLEGSFKSSEHDLKLHEEALMKISNGVMGDVIFCKQGQCRGTKKIIVALSEDGGDYKKANPTTRVKSGNQENGEKQEKVSVSSPTSSEQQDQYADIMEIAEMDYSPAKRKPPIHN